MENERFVSLQNICSHYNLEVSFVRSLNEFGLVEITRIDEVECLDKEWLGEFEKMVHLHYDLEINLAGIDAIYHLLNKVKDLQKELTILRNKLNSTPESII
jgi:hypothetical protein